MYFSNYVHLMTWFSELLNSENGDFALFLNEFNYIKNRGIVCEDEYLYLNCMVTITYWIGIPSLNNPIIHYEFSTVIIDSISLNI